VPLARLGLRDGDHRAFGSRIIGGWTSFLRRELLFIWRALWRARTINMLGLRLPARHRLISPSVRRSIYRENYERPELATVVRNVRPGDRVLECGAGIGAVSAASALIVGRSNVIAIEADPRMREVIELTWHLNGVSPTLLTGFVTNVTGEEEIVVDANLVSTGRARQEGRGERRTVPRLRLKDLLIEYQPSVLVMDIEGAEVDLLVLDEIRMLRLICVEVHPHLIGNDRCLDLIVRLRDLGLKLVIDQSAFRCLVFERDGDALSA